MGTLQQRWLQEYPDPGHLGSQLNYLLLLTTEKTSPDMCIYSVVSRLPVPLPRDLIKVAYDFWRSLLYCLFFDFC